MLSLLAVLLTSGPLFILVEGNSVWPEDDPTVKRQTIQMIGYSPERIVDYVAVSVEAIPGYIIGFEPVAHADRVHHMLLYGCTWPYQNISFWHGGATCGAGGSHILYAWARNAPNLILPHDVGFTVGHEEDTIKYFVLQIHYAQPFEGNVKDFSGVILHISQKASVNLAAVMLFGSGEPIPPLKDAHYNNVSCTYNGTTDLHPFAFRTHTHGMGRVVSAFYKREGQWNKIGVRNPQWPQLFESITTQPVIKSGDQMAATCRYDSHEKENTTYMGSKTTDEMCNFYMMFYWDASKTKENPFISGGHCTANVKPEDMDGYPVEGTELLPAHPEWEHNGHQSAVPFGVVETASINQIGSITLGQVSGLTFDLDGNLIIFHRANRVWDGNTFDPYNTLRDPTTISQDVIIFASFEENQSRVIKTMGAKKFYLPHGIYMDKEGFLYTTDVGSHTVAKWNVSGNDMQLVWEYGENQIPGSDQKHFCKPTGVVRAGNSIFVADGYCNTRVVELSLDGKRVKEFGLPGNGTGQFKLPHDISVTQEGNLVVTDRENGRVQELTTQGDFIEAFNSSMFNNIYSADAQGDHVYMIPGRKTPTGVNESEIEVFAGRIGAGILEFSFGTTSKSLGTPHILRINPAGDTVFVGDIADGKGTLWKFDISHEGGSKEGRLAPHSLSSHFPTSGSPTDSNGPPLLLLFACISVLFLLLIALLVIIIKKKVKSRTPHRGLFKPLPTEETTAFISEAGEIATLQIYA